MIESSKQYGTCPVGCKYCAVSEISSRSSLWEKNTIVGLNKAVTIINPPFDKKNEEELDKFYNFPFELLQGDIVGFNAITDPFWPKYKEELIFFLEKVSKIAKIVTCVTKFPIKEEMMEYLSQFKNFRLVVSITGLDSIENTDTKSRLKTLALAKKYGVKAFPLVHPYISGMSNLDFLGQLKELGYDKLDLKGFRYSEENMSEWISEKSKKYYQGTQEKEILIEDGWREKLENAA